MSVQAMSWAFSQDVEPHAKLVLLALANRANHETGVCYPGQALLAVECSMSSRTVRRHLRSLEDRGLIERRPRMLPEGRGRSSDEYRLAFYQPDKSSGWSGPTGQNGTTNRSNRADQPDTAVQVTVRESEGNPKDKAKRLIMIRPDWTPDPSVLEQLTVKYPRLNLTDELEAFRDYWTAKGDRRADWNASLRTWCRNADRWAKQQTAKQSRDVPHSRPVKTGPDQCPECAQRWDDHDPQVHELLRGRI